jgi:hypothetical protein
MPELIIVIWNLCLFVSLIQTMFHVLFWYNNEDYPIFNPSFFLQGATIFVLIWIYYFIFINWTRSKITTKKRDKNVNIYTNQDVNFYACLLLFLWLSKNNISFDVFPHKKVENSTFKCLKFCQNILWHVVKLSGHWVSHESDLLWI